MKLVRVFGAATSCAAQGIALFSFPFLAEDAMGHSHELYAPSPFVIVCAFCLDGLFWRGTQPRCFALGCSLFALAHG